VSIYGDVEAAGIRLKKMLNSNNFSVSVGKEDEIFILIARSKLQSENGKVPDVWEDYKVKIIVNPNK
jgi:hypothetical protein